MRMQELSSAAGSSIRNAAQRLVGIENVVTVSMGCDPSYQMPQIGKGGIHLGTLPNYG